MNIRTLAVCLLLFAFLAWAVSCNKDKSADPDSTKATGYIAYVNGQALAYEDFIRQFQREMGEDGVPEDPLSLLNRKISSLNRMVDKLLIAQEMNRLKIAVSDVEVEAAMQAIRSDYPPEGFQRILMEKGVKFEDWKASVAESVVEQKLMTQVIHPQVEVTEADMLEYYRTHPEEFSQRLQVHAYQIMVVTEAEAKAVHKRLKDGADFGVLAEEVSITPERVRGGDLGYFGPGHMPTEFDEAVFKLPLNKISDVVHTPYGYHIFLVTDKKQAQELSFEEAKDKIRQALVLERADRQYQKWIAGLRQQADISINESLLGR